MSEKATETLSEEDQMEQHRAELREARATGAVIDVEAKVIKDEPGDNAGETTTTVPAAKTDDKPADGKPAADVKTPAAEKTVEEKLAEANAELQRLRSDEGRVRAFQTKADNAARETQQLRQQLEEARKPPATESEARTKLAEIAASVKDFPELARVVEVVDQALKEVEGKATTAAEKAAQKALEPIEPLRRQHEVRQTEEQEAAIAADLATFNATYPTAQAVVQTADFKAWLPKQSQAIQWAFLKGQTPGDALPVLDAYDAHLRRTGKTPIAATQETSQQQAAEEQKPEAKPAAGADRLSRAAGLPSRSSSGAKGGLPQQDDFDGSLAFFREKRLAQQRAAAA